MMNEIPISVKPKGVKVRNIHRKQRRILWLVSPVGRVIVLQSKWSQSSSINDKLMGAEIRWGISVIDILGQAQLKNKLPRSNKIIFSEFRLNKLFKITHTRCPNYNNNQIILGETKSTLFLLKRSPTFWW